MSADDRQPDPARDDGVDSQTDRLRRAALQQYLEHGASGLEARAWTEADDDGLRELVAELFGIVDTAGIAIEVVDTEKRYVFVNRAFEDMTGYARNEVVGKTPAMMRPAARTDDDYSPISDRVVGAHDVWEGEYPRQHRDGYVYRYHARISPVRGRDGVPRLYVAVGRDVSEESARLERLERYAFYDRLTQLPNRTLFEDRLRHRLLRFERHPGELAALLFIDFDRFKDINDEYGHDVGDRLLSEVAMRLRHNARSTDTVCRLGGDEFCVLLDRIVRVEDALQVAEQIHNLIVEPIRMVNGLELVPSASIGVTVLNGSSTSVETVMREADSAMYRSKELGEDFVVFDRALDAELRRRRSLQAGLTVAAERGELRIHLQPVRHAATQRIGRLRAILSWLDAEGELHTSQDFLSFAELSGDIVSIGRWTLRQALATLSAIDEELGPQDLQIVVTVTPRQLLHDRFVAELAAMLSDAGLGPHRLVLGLVDVEGRLKQDRVQAVLHDLRTLGVAVVLENFGLGSASIDTLMHSPTSGYVMAPEFAPHIPGSREICGMFDAIHVFARVMNYEMTVPNVTTDVAAIWLSRHGYQWIEGDCVGRPMTLARVMDWLQVARAREASELHDAI